MDILLDTTMAKLVILTDTLEPWGGDLRVLLARPEGRVNLTGVEIDVLVTAQGQVICDLRLPPPGIRYRQTDQDVLTVSRLTWAPDQQVDLTVRLRLPSVPEVTAFASYRTSRPQQPYASWIWDGRDWVAPVAMPHLPPLSVAGPVWDEARLHWRIEEI